MERIAESVDPVTGRRNVVRDAVDRVQLTRSFKGLAALRMRLRRTWEK